MPVLDENLSVKNVPKCLFTSHNIFVSIMENFQIPISKMKFVLVTPYGSVSSFFKAVVKLSKFTVEK